MKMLAMLLFSPVLIPALGALSIVEEFNRDRLTDERRRCEACLNARHDAEHERNFDNMVQHVQWGPR